MRGHHEKLGLRSRGEIYPDPFPIGSAFRSAPDRHRFAGRAVKRKVPPFRRSPLPARAHLTLSVDLRRLIEEDDSITYWAKGAKKSVRFAQHRFFILPMRIDRCLISRILQGFSITGRGQALLVKKPSVFSATLGVNFRAVAAVPSVIWGTLVAADVLLGTLRCK